MFCPHGTLTLSLIYYRVKIEDYRKRDEDEMKKYEVVKCMCVNVVVVSVD